jgi:lipoyl(octanoyl) transferase
VTGRVEAGEAPEGAARRELAEETGADTQVVPLGYRHGFVVEPELAGRFGGGLVTVEETAFAARLPADFRCVRSDEHAEHAWLPLPEALLRLPYAGLRRAVRLAVETLSAQPAQV